MLLGDHALWLPQGAHVGMIEDVFDIEIKGNRRNDERDLTK